ncbi:MAG TPA: alginate lyase family protein [Blastocatellia bacterium]|nr:alginate lyase family protein [Blastocatellia bacterium]
MQSGFAQLKKLRGKSLSEIGVRGLQELAKMSERLLGTRELSEAALRREIQAAARTTAFLPALAHRSAIAQLMSERFAAERATIIERAERARRGRFDLLGIQDLSFGLPIDWHLEPRAGKRTPLDHWSRIAYLDTEVAGDKKITWELNRCGHFVTFGQAYWMTGDERFAAAFVEQATAWMDANPVGRGINWASSLEVSFRAIAWLWALHLLSDSPALDAAFVARLLKCLIAHGRHIEKYLSTYFSPNTHLTGEALGLFYLGAALPELRRAAGWRATGLRILLEQLPIHLRTDGVYFEQTTYYHRYTVDFYLHLTMLARVMNLTLPVEVETRLSAALDYLMWTTRPDGHASLVGDDDGGRLIQLGARSADDFRDTLATGAALLSRGDWKFVAGTAAAETLWLLGPEALTRFDAITAQPPASNAQAFAESGYFVMRDGWAAAASYAVIDCGAHGVQSCGHAHADQLAFEFAARGKTWLVDPGTFTYTGDREMRDWFRSTAAHNTVTVDGEQQSTTAGPFAWAQIAEPLARWFFEARGAVYFEGAHNGYERLTDPVTHRRALLFVRADDAALPSYLIVRDRFEARAAHRYAARYHFAAGCMATAQSHVISATSAEGQLSIHAFGSSAAAARIESGWVSRAYGERQPAPVAVIESEGAGRQALVTFIVPANGSISCTGDGSAFLLSSGDTLDLIITGDSTSDQLKAQAEMAMARFVNQRLTRACLVRGRRIEIANTLTLADASLIDFAEITVADDALEITIHGTSRFELSFSQPPRSVVVNGARFSVVRECANVAFALGESGWTLTDRA